MKNRQEAWFDEAAGPLVRPYAVTGGRTRATRHDLELITLVVALSANDDAPAMAPDYEHVLQVCGQPQSVAEVAAHVNLPLRVAKVLISDLIDRGRLGIRSDWGNSIAPDVHLLQKVLDGIRTL